MNPLQNTDKAVNYKEQNFFIDIDFGICVLSQPSFKENVFYSV